MKNLDPISGLAPSLSLSLYIHLPWCIRKCPYCDFNSHALKNDLPEKAYIAALLRDLQQDLPYVQDRPVQSIFFGGGTPSLFSPAAITELLHQLQKHLQFAPDIEITLEANPGTVEQQRFQGFFNAGVNRLSLGIQSLQDDKLKILGRIHDSHTAIKAIIAAKNAGFSNINCDLMFGLPTQTIKDALLDLENIMAHQPKHISWYQLTLEPNTFFAKYPPKLPDDELIFIMQEQGQALLAKAGYEQYEVSSYSKTNFQCGHNRNYWEFGDYLGIGAGAHSKLTDFSNQQIVRLSKRKHPQEYLNSTDSFIQEQQVINPADLPFEFMLNVLRLNNKIPLELFVSRCGLPYHQLELPLQKAIDAGLLICDGIHFETTSLGRRFLNDLMQLFLPSKS